MLRFIYRFPVPETQLYDIGNWHSPYFFMAFFEARIALFESFGVTQEKIKNEGYAIIAGSLQCKYYYPLLKGDVALIAISPTRIGRSSMTFSYKVHREGDNNGRIYAEGETTQIIIDRKTKRSVEIPDWIRSHLAKLIEN